MALMAAMSHEQPFGRDEDGVYLNLFHLTPSKTRISQTAGGPIKTRVRFCPFCGENLEGEKWKKITP